MLHLSHACELLYIKKLFRFHVPPSGDFNYLGTTLRQNDIEPMPSLSDVRQVISLYAILPLGMAVSRYTLKYKYLSICLWLKMSVVFRLSGGSWEGSFDQVHPSGWTWRCGQEDVGARRVPGDRRHPVWSLPPEHGGEVPREERPRHDGSCGV